MGTMCSSRGDGGHEAVADGGLDLCLAAGVVKRRRFEKAGLREPSLRSLPRVSI